jgi:hypothetical protein
MKEFEGLKVQCPGCKGIFYETTDKYIPDTLPNGSFVRLRKKWRDWNWDPFDGALATTATSCSMMNCTSCGAPLAPSGRLTVLPRPTKKGEHRCRVCGRICHSAAGLGAHMRVHRAVDKKEK